jgi:hypothetical protein
LAGILIVRPIREMMRAEGRRVAKLQVDRAALGFQIRD